MVPDESTRIHDAPSTQATAYRATGDPAALVGLLLGGAFRIEGKIGEGGMGVVFRATQVALDRPVAVKLVHSADKLPASAVDRFLREARLLSHLHHPNIVQVIDFGTEAGPLHYLVMEFLGGEPLDHFVGSRPRLTPGLVLALMEQVCAGTSAAHAAHVIHRDLKPSNLFVGQVTGGRPVVKILDFGLAKSVEDGKGTGSGITREGVTMGTTGYSAPEQLHGGAADELSDVYGLGAVLYFLVAGRPPYRDEGVKTTLVKQLTDPPDPIEPHPAWPRLKAVEAVVHKAMSVRPSDRHRTPAELFAHLAQALGDACPPPSPSPAAARRPWLYLAVSLGLLAVLTVAAWLKFGPLRAAPSQKEPLRFGLSAPFTGPTKELGHGIKLGIEARFAAQNAAGGVHGRRLVLVHRDDGYEPGRAADNVRRLIAEDDVFAFVGNVGSPTNKAALPVALEHRRLLFAPYSGARFLRGDPPNRYVFNYRAGYDDETAAIVEHLLGARGIAPEEIAVFAQEDDYGDDGFEGVARSLRKKGRRHDAILRVGYKRNTTDVGEAARKVAAQGERVKAVVMVATYQPAAEFVVRLRDLGSKAVCTNISFVGSDSLSGELRARGRRYVEGLIVTQTVPPLDSGATGVVRFRDDLKRHAPDEPASFVALEGHVSASLLIDALTRAGPDPTTEGLIDELERTRELDLGVGPPLEFRPSRHQATKKVWAIEYDAEGRYREVELE